MWQSAIIIIIVNATLIISFFFRFFKLMNVHYKVVDDVTKNNLLINKVHQTLYYIQENVKEAAKQIHEDIHEELILINKITQFRSKVSSIVKRSEFVKEIVTEYARSNPDTESIIMQTVNNMEENNNNLRLHSREMENVLKQVHKSQRLSKF